MSPTSAYSQFVEAADAKDFDTLARLLQEQPDLHNADGDEGPLVDIILFRCPEFFEAAFKAGLSPDSGPASPHQTLLQRAVCDSDLNLVGLCLKYGADIERRNCEGETALGYAASWGSLETVQLLVQAGADVNAIEGNDPFYSTALQMTFDRPEVHQYLRAQGAKTYEELKEEKAAGDQNG